MSSTLLSLPSWSCYVMLFVGFHFRWFDPQPFARPRRRFRQRRNRFVPLIRRQTQCKKRGQAWPQAYLGQVHPIPQIPGPWSVTGSDERENILPPLADTGQRSLKQTILTACILGAFPLKKRAEDSTKQRFH